jgi:hypothetical protein
VGGCELIWETTGCQTKNQLGLCPCCVMGDMQNESCRALLSRRHELVMDDEEDDGARDGVDGDCK